MTQSARLHRHAQTPISAAGLQEVGQALHTAANSCFMAPVTTTVIFYSHPPVQSEFSLPPYLQETINQHNSMLIQHQGPLSDITPERLAACRVATIDVRPEHGPTEAWARLELRNDQRRIAVYMQADQVLPIALGPVAQAWRQQTQPRSQRAILNGLRFLRELLP